jgi:hypothetical protein
MRFLKQRYQPSIVLIAGFAGLCATPACATEGLSAPIHLVWSPSGKHAAFMTEQDGDGDASCPTAMHELNLDTMSIQLLLKARTGARPEEDLSCLNDVKYSADGALVYFTTPAWFTSGALHALDRRTGAVSFIIDGGPYLVIGTGPLEGMLIVVRRKYAEGMDEGAYEELDLVDPKTGTANPLAKKLPNLLVEATSLTSVQMRLKEQKGWVSW